MTTPLRAGRREWIALAVLALPLLLVSMDVSVLYFAVPFISADLHATATQQLWIFDVYGFVLAGLLITMGALGDRIGRRRLLLCGAAGFGLASVAAAFAQDPGQLIVARAALGVGGATLMPSTLALVRNMFHDDAQRAKAIAVWSAVMTGGVSLGPILSGLLLEHFWWGSVFLINVPAMLLLLVLGPVLLPEFRAPRAGRFDLSGSLLSLGAILPVVYGIKHAAAEGIGTVAIASVAIGLLLGVLFWRRQRQAAHPMIDLTMFANRVFGAGLLANTVAAFALVGNAVFMTQYLQLVLGMSPLRAALWSLAPSAAVAGAAPAASALAGRHGRAPVIVGGFVLGALGFGVISLVRPESPLTLVLAGAGVLACGVVAVMTLVTALVLGAVPPSRAGAASALMETGSELGGALGIALLGSLGAAVYRARLHTSVSHARDGLAGAVGAAAHLPSPAAHDLLVAARAAFVSGLDVVAIVGAAVLVLTACSVGRLLRSRVTVSVAETTLVSHE
ncbi:MAG TPA: MFS transporter [Jatrophihabitans sp.]|nr:MFS transporter [Jatrophihabitans sp.]